MLFAGNQMKSNTDKCHLKFKQQTFQLKTAKLKVIIDSQRFSRSQLVFKIGVLKYFGNFKGKRPCLCLSGSIFFKKRLQHRCFPVQNTLGGGFGTVNFENHVNDVCCKANKKLMCCLIIVPIFGCFMVAKNNKINIYLKDVYD